MNLKVFLIGLLIINCISCNNYKGVEEEKKYKIILGIELGNNYSKAKQILDSLSSLKKISSANNNAFNFVMPLIDDSINCKSSLSAENFYKSKLYYLNIFSEVEGSWLKVSSASKQLKELLDYKYQSVTKDSVHGNNYSPPSQHDANEISIWKEGELSVRLETTIWDISNVSKGKDWNRSSEAVILTVSDMLDKDPYSKGRFIILMYLKYVLENKEKDYFIERKSKEDSVNDIQNQYRVRKKDSLTKNL